MAQRQHPFKRVSRTKLSPDWFISVGPGFTIWGVSLAEICTVHPIAYLQNADLEFSIDCFHRKLFLTDSVVSETWPCSIHSPSLNMIALKILTKQLQQKTWFRRKSFPQDDPPSNPKYQEDPTAFGNGQCSWQKVPCRECRCLTPSQPPRLQRCIQ